MTATTLQTGALLPVFPPDLRATILHLRRGGGPYNHALIVDTHLRMRRWFAQNVLPLLNPGIANWQDPTEHETWPGYYGIRTNVDERYSRGARHLTTFRFGKSRANSAKNFVVLAAPYTPTCLIETATLTRFQREVIPIDLLILPDAWSPHFPGWTGTILFAPPCILNPSREVRRALHEENANNQQYVAGSVAA